MNDPDFYSPDPAPRPNALARTVLPGPKAGNLRSIILRIEEAVEAETEAIRSDVNFDLKASIARKSRYLYELNRAVKDVPGAEALAPYRADIARLRTKLERNEAAIRAHLSAVNEVASLLQGAIERSEADGTYTTNAFAGRVP